jgi:FAD:protein FMN transferase
MSRKKQVVMLTCFALIVLLFGCATLPIGQPKGVKETQFIMDTIIEITAYGPQAQAAIDNAFAEMKRIDGLMNIYDENSEASKINAMAGKGPVVVSDDMLFVLEKSLYFSELTHGAFDVTIGPLTTLWGIGKKDDYVPSSQEIAQVKSRVNYQDLKIDKNQQTVFLTKPGMMIDLGSVGKGYAVDRAIAIMKQHQVKSALVNAGGSIRVIGSKPDGKPWRIGVQHPRMSDGLVAKVALTQWDALDTSGDYQRFFIKDGVRYHHILDPKTGMPGYRNSSNSIAMNSALDADILNTALFLLDVETGLRLMQTFPGADALWVSENGQVTITPGFEGKLEVTTAGR